MNYLDILISSTFKDILSQFWFFFTPYFQTYFFFQEPQDMKNVLAWLNSFNQCVCFYVYFQGSKFRSTKFSDHYDQIRLIGTQKSEKLQQNWLLDGRDTTEIYLK